MQIFIENRKLKHLSRGPSDTTNNALKLGSFEQVEEKFSFKFLTSVNFKKN